MKIELIKSRYPPEVICKTAELRRRDVFTFLCAVGLIFVFILVILDYCTYLEYEHAFFGIYGILCVVVMYMHLLERYKSDFRSKVVFVMNTKNKGVESNSEVYRYLELDKETIDAIYRGEYDGYEYLND